MEQSHGTGVGIISESRLMREGLKAFLRETDFKTAFEATSIRALPDQGTPPESDIILLDAGTRQAGLIDEVQYLTRTFPDSSVVVLADMLDIQPLIDCLAAGAAGYLLKEISSDALVSSLGVVRSGEKVFPAHTLSLLLDSPPVAGPDDARVLGEMSAREREILACLVEGASNKGIARRLRITEATVKVHLKSLMRKIDCRNRTQAAIWGVRHGIRTRPGPSAPPAPPPVERARRT